MHSASTVSIPVDAVFGSSPLVKTFHILHYSQGRFNILGNVRLNDGRRREGVKKKEKWVMSIYNKKNNRMAIEQSHGYINTDK